MRPDDLARLKNLEKENARLKRLLAEKELDNDMLRARQGEMVTPNQQRVAFAQLVAEFGVSKPSVPGGQPTLHHPAPLHHPQSPIISRLLF